MSPTAEQPNNFISITNTVYMKFDEKNCKIKIKFLIYERHKQKTCVL